MKRESKKHNIIKKLLVSISIIILAVLFAIGIFLFMLNRAVPDKVERIDDNGYLYYTNYTEDYYKNKVPSLMVKIARNIGCSSFVTRDKKGNYLTGRNIDYPYTDKDNNVTGLNVFFHLSPKGKYRSINGADVCCFSLMGLPYFAGSLDDGKTTHLPLGFLPYLCTDGINEKGLVASILALDLKDGESSTKQNDSGKQTLVINELLRYVLDSCANVEETINFAKSVNIVAVMGAELHLFVSDASGKSVVLEWRNNELLCTKADAVTNFYVSSDDGQDCYIKGVFKEKFTKVDNLQKKYHWGYGHGYERFNKMVTRLSESNYVMSSDEAMNLLEYVSQKYDWTDLGSNTQFSAVYNNTERSVEVCPMMDYSKKYYFSI